MAERSNRERPSIVTPSLHHHQTVLHPSQPSSHASTPFTEARPTKDPKDRSFFSSFFNRGPGIRNGSSDSTSPTDFGSKKAPQSSGLGLGMGGGAAAGLGGALGLSPTELGASITSQLVTGAADLGVRSYTQAELETRMGAVESSAMAGLSTGEKIDAVQELVSLVSGVQHQARLPKDSQSEESDEISPISPVGGGFASIGYVAISAATLPRERLIRIALRIATLDQATHKQKLRMCGYQLLHATLQRDPGGGDRESLDLPLAVVLRIAETTLSPLPSTESTGSYSLAEEVAHRLLNLSVITNDGADISCGHSYGIVREIIEWTRLVGKEWTRWCAEGGIDLDCEKDAGSQLASKEGGGLGILSPPIPRPFNLPSLDSREPSPASARLDSVEDVGAGSISTLSDLLHFLMLIARYNLPLFTPADITVIIRLHIDLLNAGIQACYDSQSARAAAGPGDGSRSRSLSTSGTAARPRRSASKTPVAPTSGLSRGASVKRQAAGGFSVPIATVPLPQVSKALDVVDDLAPRPRQRWTTLLQSYTEGVRTFLGARVVPPIVVTPLVRSICFATGLCVEHADDGAHGELGRLTRDLLCDVAVGRTSERALRVTMERQSEPAASGGGGSGLVLAQGAVALVRFILRHTDSDAPDEGARHTGQPATLPFAFTFHSLIDPLARAVQAAQHDPAIASEVLAILQDRLDQLQLSGTTMIAPIEQSVSDLRAPPALTFDAWSEGDAICSLLTAFTSTIGGGSVSALHGSHDKVAVTFYEIVQRLPAALGSLQSSSTNPVFWHPDFVTLLMSISGRLSADLCMELIDHHRSEGLCLPGCPDWKSNASGILEAFYERPAAGRARAFWCSTPADETRVRVNVARLIFKDTYETIKDFTDSRHQLGTEVILPIVERSLAKESDEEIERWIWEVLVSLVVRETIEQDEARRQAETLADDDLELSTTLEPVATGEIFNIVRTMLLRLARQSPCVAKLGEDLRPMSLASDPDDSTHIASRDHSVAPDLRRSAIGSPAPLPPFATADAPSRSATTGQGREHVHTRCKSLHACNTMIALFTRLAFSMPHALITSNAKYARLPASASCITLFDDMLRLLAPNIGSVSRQELTSAACTQARLSILQWLMRLRANTQHRIWVKPALDDQAMAPATVFGRLRERAGLEVSAAAEDGPSRRRAARADVPMTTDRGREHRALPDATAGRSRSRSRQPPVREARAVARVASKPMWYIPDEFTFELPADARPSEGMTTYDPAGQASVAAGARTARSGVWLKISKYIEVLIAILSFESDWELVSYTLAFLPFQLANKHFFCGPSSAEWLRALRKQLCDGLADDKIAGQAALPAGVRRTDVRAVAYQTLTVLISYKRLYGKKELGQIVDAFTKGLSGGHKVMAKPCIQALTLAAYELQDSLVTYIPTILETLDNIMTSRGLSAHVLEFLFAVGQAPSLYRNFTEDHYQTVFKMTVTYIQMHNDVRTREEMATEDEEFTVSQHVLALSYFCIYIWFIAVELGRRPTYVTYLTRNIIAAFPDRKIDESAEVCFDWLSRYTYGNADPKPAVDPMEAIVFGDGVDYPIKHWLLGNGLISLQTQPQTGWTKFTMRRASGTVVMLAKVQNVPVIGLGEENADLYLEPALMERNRIAEVADTPAASAPVPIRSDRTSRMAEPAPAMHTITSGQSLLLSSSPTDRVHMVSPSLPANNEQFSLVWAGSAPSQRRKVVTIDPGFVGLQLSAYPYVSIDAPRGRIIPPEARPDATIRILDITPVIDAHKVAVLYVGPGQTTEQEILANRDGSPAFLRFVAGLGRLVKLRGQTDVYPGGLDTKSDEDGEYAYAWWDDLAQVVFHTPHLMPNEEVSEPGRIPQNNNKKRHVGNDFVKIVFNDSGAEYAFDTIACQCNLINVVISSHTSGVSGGYDDSAEHDFFKVTVQKVKGMPDFSAVGDMKLVSAAALPTFVRQLVMLADMLVSVHKNTVEMGRSEYITSWRHRHQTIARLRERLPAIDTSSLTEAQKMEYVRDFTRGF